MHIQIWMFVVILGCGASASIVSLTPPGIEHIRIHGDHLISLHVGDPGKWVQFRIHTDTPDIYLFQDSSAYSTSWTESPINMPNCIRESMLIGNTQVRADIIIGSLYSETPATIEGTRAEGIFGISPTSPLWTIWRNFTKTRDGLYLGRVLKRSGPDSYEALPATLPPPWAYSPDLVTTLVAEYVAHISESTRHALQQACIKSIGPNVDNAIDFADIDPELAALLDVSPQEQLCEIPTTFRLLIAPQSDYNIVPNFFMLHAQNSPPVFHIKSLVNAHQHSMETVLFDRFEDAYFEIDSTNPSGSGVKRSSNLVRSGNVDTIIIGTFGLRRFEFSVLFDQSLSYLALRHDGMSIRGETHETEHSIEVHQIPEVWMLFAVILLWAFVSVEPNLVYPSHTQDPIVPDPYAHSKQLRVKTNANPLQIGANPAQHDDNIIVVRLGSDLPKQEYAEESVVPKLTKDQERRIVANETLVACNAVLVSTLNMQCEWNLPIGTILYVQALLEAMIAAYIAFAMIFYDTTWALTFVLSSDASTDTLGWVSFGLLIACIVFFSWVATCTAGRDARLGCMVLQANVLLSFYILLISLFQWDPALVLILVVIAILTIVLLVTAFTVHGIMPQYNKIDQQLYKQLKVPMTIGVVAWIMYSMIAVLPYIIDRLWDNENKATGISIFVTLSVAIPLSIYMTNAPFLYPILVANKVCNNIIANGQKRYNDLT